MQKDTSHGVRELTPQPAPLSPVAPSKAPTPKAPVYASFGGEWIPRLELERARQQVMRTRAASVQSASPAPAGEPTATSLDRRA